MAHPAVAPNNRPPHNLPLRVTVGLVVLCLYSALVPFRFVEQWRWERVAELLTHGATDGAGHRLSAGDAVVNFAAGLPLGWFALLAFRRLLPAAVAWLLAVLVGILTALAMEVLQLLSAERVSTLSDVVFIGCGSGCGGLAAYFAADRLWAFAQRTVLPYLRAGEGRLELALLLALLAFRSFFPDDIVASLGDLRGTLRQANIIPGEMPGRHLLAQLRSLGFDVGTAEHDALRTWPNLTPVHYVFNLAGHFLLYALIGGCFAIVRRRSGLLAVAIPGLTVGLTALCVETLQLLFPSQGADVNVVLAGLAGGTAGAAVSALVRKPSGGQYGGTLRLVCLLGVVGYVATQYLRPGETWPQPWSLSYHALIPMYHYHRGSHRLDIFRDMIEAAALFAPVGWIAAAWARRRGWKTGRLLAGALSASVLLAAALELVQPVVGRVASIDDVLWAGLGGWLGYRMERWTFANRRGAGSGGVEQRAFYRRQPAG